MNKHTEICSAVIYTRDNYVSVRNLNTHDHLYSTILDTDVMHYEIDFEQIDLAYNDSICIDIYLHGR